MKVDAEFIGRDDEGSETVKLVYRNIDIDKISTIAENTLRADSIDNIIVHLKFRDID